LSCRPRCRVAVRATARVLQRGVTWWWPATCWGSCQTRSSAQHSSDTCGVSEQVWVVWL
jgi:hypothetical protein